MKDLYKNRFLSEGYPELEKLSVEHFSATQEIHENVKVTLTRLGRLIDLSKEPRTVAVVGCGPNPSTVKNLLELGYDAIGIEPVVGSAEAAKCFLGDPTRVLIGSAESMPFIANSQRVVIMESVLEHVDSLFKTLSEMYRILAPGGVLYIYTTNRLRFSLSGANGEFRTRFYNWFPPLVKESYVFQHLHYNPRLSNFTPRPAVHWFTYAELCESGRQAGFGQFYSPLDLAAADDPSIQGSCCRKWFLKMVRLHPWFRALALRQYGNAIFMLKRQ